MHRVGALPSHIAVSWVLKMGLVVGRKPWWSQRCLFRKDASPGTVFGKCFALPLHHPMRSKEQAKILRIVIWCLKIPVIPHKAVAEVSE